MKALIHKANQNLKNLLIQNFNNPTVQTNRKINIAVEEIIFLVATQNENITFCNIYDENFEEDCLQK